VNASSPKFKEAWKEWQKVRMDSYRELVNRAGLSSLELGLADDTETSLRRYFEMRRAGK
jgi:hypothetical protein